MALGCGPGWPARGWDGWFSTDPLTDKFRKGMHSRTKLGIGGLGSPLSSPAPPRWVLGRGCLEKFALWPFGPKRVFCFPVLPPTHPAVPKLGQKKVQ